MRGMLSGLESFCWVQLRGYTHNYYAQTFSDEVAVGVLFG